MRFQLTTLTAGLAVLLTSAVLSPRASAEPASSPLWASLEKGRYPVGFRIFLETDLERPALPPDTGRGRKIPIAIWYPAKPSSSPPMRLRDYVIAAEEALIGVAPKDPTTVIDSFTKPVLEGGVDRSDLDRLLETPGVAVRDALPSAERFPLVLFAHASPETESVMCEYLASHGYVVAAVRSRGVNEVAYKLSRENLDAMVSDNQLAAARAPREFNIDPGPLGVIGMSNGSIAAVALQLKGVKIGAIVSLDGGIGENSGGSYLKGRTNGDVSKLTAPILHFYAPNNPHLNLDHLRSYNASARTLIFVRGMRHVDFLAYPIFDQIVAGFSTPKPSADALPGFVWVNRYTLNFLNAKLRNDGASSKWFATDPTGHGEPPGLLTVERLEPAKAP